MPRPKLPKDKKRVRIAITLLSEALKLLPGINRSAEIESAIHATYGARPLNKPLSKRESR